MANDKHIDILSRGVKEWNAFRANNFDLVPELSGADLREFTLTEVNFYKAKLDEAILDFCDLRRATLTSASLRKASLRHANLTGADLDFIDLSEAQLENAYLIGANILDATLIQTNLRSANLTGAHLHKTDLTQADLNQGSLERVTLVETKLVGANLTDCKIYGISAWDLLTDESTIHTNLTVTKSGESELKVDDLEVAQFIYLLLKNEKIRDVLNTITSKAVLILGRFTDERMKILNGIRDELRGRGYIPIIYNFVGSENRTVTETITTLARLSYFVIADISSPRSVPQELYAIVPHLVSVPVQPTIDIRESEYSMFNDLLPYPWVLNILRYDDWEDLRNSIDAEIIVPAENKAKELMLARKR